MWTTLKKRCPHAHSPNKCKGQPRNNIDQEAALASPHSAHHSQAPRQPAHRFPRGGNFFIAAGNQDLLVDGLLECLPYVRKHRLFLPRPSTGIGRWTTFLPPLARRRTTRADLVIFGRGALRSVGLRFERLAASGIGFFGHGTDPPRL